MSYFSFKMVCLKEEDKKVVIVKVYRSPYIPYFNDWAGPKTLPHWSQVFF
jgi:hypothetical protein